MAKWQEEVELTARAFVEELGVAAQVEVVYDPQNDAYQVNLSCDDPGILIGHHGDTLAALQLMVGQHLKAKTGEWVNLSVNVNDYRQRREQVLQQLADNTVDRVTTSGQPYSLPPLPASERRLVHLYLADHPKVVTESIGIGRSRSVVISPKV